MIFDFRRQLLVVLTATLDARVTEHDTPHENVGQAAEGNVDAGEPSPRVIESVGNGCYVEPNDHEVEYVGD